MGKRVQSQGDWKKENLRNPLDKRRGGRQLFISNQDPYHSLGDSEDLTEGGS